MIYLDNAATTQIDEEVLDSMLPYLREQYGNPSSKYYSFSDSARNAVEEAREKVAQLIGATSEEIIFTSGSTESSNLIIKGVLDYSKYYGIDGINEARAYMQDSILRARLVEITQALENQEQTDLPSIVGDVDSLKIHACMSLFYVATKESCFKRVLIKYFKGKLHLETIKLLKLKSYNINEV